MGSDIRDSGIVKKGKFWVRTKYCSIKKKVVVTYYSKDPTKPTIKKGDVMTFKYYNVKHPSIYFPNTSEVPYDTSCEHDDPDEIIIDDGNYDYDNEEESEISPSENEKQNLIENPTKEAVVDNKQKSEISTVVPHNNAQQIHIENPTNEDVVDDNQEPEISTVKTNNFQDILKSWKNMITENTSPPLPKRPSEILKDTKQEPLVENIKAF